MKTLKRVLGAISLLALLSNNCWAGDPSEATEDESVATSALEINVPVLYKISGVNDINITDVEVSAATLDGAGLIQKPDTVCIYSNAFDTRDYQIKMAGSSGCTPSGSSCDNGGVAWANNKFFVAEDTNNHQAIAYRPSFEADSTHGYANATWTKGGALATSGDFTGASTAVDCGSVDNASFGITIESDDLLSVKSGDYTGTLTITLLPPS